MTAQVRARFDGKVLCPEEPLDLKLNTWYLVTIKPVDNDENGSNAENDPAFDLASLAVKTGIADFAAEHDHYLYSLPKRG